MCIPLWSGLVMGYHGVRDFAPKNHHTVALAEEKRNKFKSFSARTKCDTGFCVHAELILKCTTSL